VVSGDHDPGGASLEPVHRWLDGAGKGVAEAEYPPYAIDNVVAIVGGDEGETSCARRGRVG